VSKESGFLGSAYGWVLQGVPSGVSFFASGVSIRSCLGIFWSVMSLGGGSKGWLGLVAGLGGAASLAFYELLILRF
jgi:hypothetical protein